MEPNEAQISTEECPRKASQELGGEGGAHYGETELLTV